RSSANCHHAPETRENCELRHSFSLSRAAQWAAIRQLPRRPGRASGEAMIPVYIAQSALDAQLVRDLLTGSGIHAHVFGPNVAGAIPEVPASGLIRVVVEDDEAEEAKALIRDWESTPDEAEVEAATFEAADGVAIDLQLPDDEALDLDLLADPDVLLGPDELD